MLEYSLVDEKLVTSNKTKQNKKEKGKKKRKLSPMQLVTHYVTFNQLTLWTILLQSLNMFWGEHLTCEAKCIE
jgi:hypothetical protein